MKEAPENQEVSPADEAIDEYVGVLLEDPESAPFKREEILRELPELEGNLNAADEVIVEVLKEKPFLDQEGEETKERGREEFMKRVEKKVAAYERLQEILAKLESMVGEAVAEDKPLSYVKVDALTDEYRARLEEEEEESENSS